MSINPLNVLRSASNVSKFPSLRVDSVPFSLVSIDLLTSRLESSHNALRFNKAQLSNSSVLLVARHLEAHLEILRRAIDTVVATDDEIETARQAQGLSLSDVLLYVTYSQSMKDFLHGEFAYIANSYNSLVASHVKPKLP